MLKLLKIQVASGNTTLLFALSLVVRKMILVQKCSFNHLPLFKSDICHYCRLCQAVDIVAYQQVSPLKLVNPLRLDEGTICPFGIDGLTHSHLNT